MPERSARLGVKDETVAVLAPAPPAEGVAARVGEKRWKVFSFVSPAG